MQNITLSANEDLIAQARELAKARGTTLNQEFRDWLAGVVERQGQDAKLAKLRKLMVEVTTPLPGQSFIPADTVFPADGKGRWAREEFNEREQRMINRLNCP